MQSDPSALSSDLDRARALSRRLRRPREKSAAGASAPRFELGRVAPPSPEPATERHAVEEAIEDARGAELWKVDNLGSRFWNDLLLECLTQTRGEGGTGAFAVDGQGLCIAQVGDIDPEKVEGTGSRLVIALEHASRMESFAARRPGSILIEFGEEWLTGFSVECGDGSRVVLGIIARQPLSERSRELVTSLVGELLAR